MAQWDKILSRGNVNDRRGMNPGVLAGGGLGLGGVVIFLLLNFLGGGNPEDVLNQLPNIQTMPVQNYEAKDFEGADNYEVFASTVLGSANDMWEDVFSKNNKTYTEPTLVLFRGATQSSCGGADSRTGPHYCQLDKVIYLDETFFEELKSRFGAEGGDVAESYVIAHEVGHHVQNLLGSFDIQNEQDSIALELQADCYAGLWAHSIKDLGVFEEGEIHEAIDAAAAVGDDRIQATIEGRVSPETWTHGSSEQRTAAFSKGYSSGSVQECTI
jgi:uncharacterized protein